MCGSAAVKTDGQAPGVITKCWTRSRELSASIAKSAVSRNGVAAIYVAGVLVLFSAKTYKRVKANQANPGSFSGDSTDEAKGKVANLVDKVSKHLAASRGSFMEALVWPLDAVIAPLHCLRNFVVGSDNESGTGDVSCS
jgi:hypothetical protein